MFHLGQTSQPQRDYALQMANPVATPPKYSAAYWRELADHALARADATASPNARLRGLKIARIFEELAESERKLEGDATGIALKENRGARGH